MIKNFYIKLYNLLSPKFFLNNIWHKQLFRKYFFNTKNIFFNEFLLQNILDTTMIEANFKKKKLDTALNSVQNINTDLWSNYVLLWRHEQEQRLLDNLFLKSRYYKNFTEIEKPLKNQKQQKNLFNRDLILWYQLGYSIDVLKTINNNVNINNYFKNMRSTILLEDSLEYQHKLNIHLVGVLDYMSSLYEKDLFVQSKTFRGIFLRFFREIVYPWFSCFIFTFTTLFTIISEFLYLISSFVAIPLLFILFIYSILTDTLANFDFETAWLQINFFEFIFQKVTVYNFNSILISDYDISIFFNNFCWACLFFFFFFMLLFEGAGWLSILMVEEDNLPQDLYSDEGTLIQDIDDSCNLRVLELMLELSDFDFTNTDTNNYYILSENSDEFRDIEGAFSDLNQFGLQLFGGGMGILYMMQLVIQQDDIDDNELDDLYYYEGLTKHNKEEDEPDLDLGSFLSYSKESDSSFGLYEYPLDAGNINFTKYDGEIILFDEEGDNIEAYISMPAHGFDVFSESSFNYFFDYVLGISIFEIFIFLIIFLYTLLYFKIYYDWEVWVYREYAAREYFNRITFLGWQHSLTNEEVISDDDILNNITISENNTVNFAGNEQLLFSRDISPHITDIEFLFEDIEELLDFKMEHFAEEDYEFVDEDEFASLIDILENYDYNNIAVNEFENNVLNDYSSTLPIVNSKEQSDLALFTNVYENFNLYDQNFNFGDFFFNMNKIVTYFFNIKNFFLTYKKNFNSVMFLKTLFESSDIFIYFYKNLDKITNSVLRYQILQIVFFYLNIKKGLLKKLNYKYQHLSNAQLILLHLNFKKLSKSTILFEIQNEIIELLITENIEEFFENLFDEFFSNSDLEHDLLDIEFFENMDDINDNTFYNKDIIPNIFNTFKMLMFKQNFNHLNCLFNITLYSTFFQNNLIGSKNFLILDEENDIQMFFSDFEDDAEYFNVDTLDVDMIDSEDLENDLSLDYDAELDDDEDVSDDFDQFNDQDDLWPDTVYTDDENPYDLFSYDFFFFSKFEKKKTYPSLQLFKNNFLSLSSENHLNSLSDFKLYYQQFNNFSIYSWSSLNLSNNIQPMFSLYNVTSVLDLEFDTNYIEIDDDELYDDENFLVPTQRLLIHQLINNFRYENYSWLDGWGTWSFLNYNKYEGSLDLLFEYDIFHSDDEIDTDEEDMIEMNITYFSDTFQDMYNDNLIDDSGEFLDALPELSSIFDDLDDFEEDFVEISYLVEKPYVFIIIFILFFECFSIFFIEYYFIFFIFLEPENVDIFFSDIIDYRYTGVFFDILKLKSYSIVLFISDFLTFENNFFNELKTYQLIYYSIFCYLDEPSGIVGTEYFFFQQYTQQTFMLYWMSIYEEYIVPIINYFLTTEEVQIEDNKDDLLSTMYYKAYKEEPENSPYKSTYYYYYLYYSVYEQYVEIKDFILLQFENIECFYYFIKKIFYFVKLFFFIGYYWFYIICHFFYYLFIYLMYVPIECEDFLFGEFNFFFNSYITTAILFLWRLPIFEFLLFIDYLVYLVNNCFVIAFFDLINIYIINFYDFVHAIKKDKIIVFIFQPLNYISTFQELTDLTIKNITLINKEIVEDIGYFEKCIVQLSLVLNCLHIIIDVFFNFFFSEFLLSNYCYLLVTVIEFNLLNLYYVLEIFFFYIVYIGFIKVVYWTLLVLQLYNYDLYYIYIITLYSIFSVFIVSLKFFRIQSLSYNINRHQQFDDKLYYNGETILNIYPEILYDIETLTFINNSFDSYLYWF